jgi:hypothetical protein
MGPAQEATMATKAPAHPCDRGKAFEPWKADHLYIDDDGRIACGRCMGVESTYKPWAYSDLGQMASDRTVTLPPMWIELGTGQKVLQGAMAYRCETDQYAKH